MNQRQSPSELRVVGPMSTEMKGRRRRKLIERDGWACAICKNPMTERTLTIDHVVPLALGGTHALENQRLAHRRCNGKRGSQHAFRGVFTCEHCNGLKSDAVHESATPFTSDETKERP